MTNLTLLSGERANPASLPDPLQAHATGLELLQRNTARLFGPMPDRRRARIMISYNFV